MSEVDAPACPVHPYGYHSRPRVAPSHGRRVFRDHSLAGVPARCTTLEHELDEADLEVAFIDELWALERAPRTRFWSMSTALATATATVAALYAEASAGVIAAVVVGGALVSFGCDRAEASVHRQRLTRVRDWHKRVGTPR